MTVTLKTYLGSTVQDTSVSLPDEGTPGGLDSEDWRTEFQSSIDGLLGHIQRTTVERAGVGVSEQVIASASSHVIDLTTLETKNPLITDFEVFFPVLVYNTTGDKWSPVYPSAAGIDVYVNASAKTLTIENNTGASVTISGFIMFPQYANYVAAFGSI